MSNKFKGDMTMLKKSISVFVAILIILLTVSVSFASGIYSESSAATLLRSLNIMSGDENGNLNLNDNVTRAEFSKIAVNASKYKNSVALGAQISVFKDCTYTHWAAPYVKVAVTNAILTGYPDGTFKPENTVLYEEAITVILRLLGYNDEDFGSSWPYGQASIAANLSLNKNVSKGIGDVLTRRDVMTLIYNMLTSKTKGSDSDYIGQIDGKFYEDAVIIATNKEDTSVGSNSVLTSVGTFKFNPDFDYSFVGLKGDLAVKSNGEMLTFMPYMQSSDKYVVYSVLSNSVAAYNGAILTELNMSDNTVVYTGTEKKNFASVKNTMKIGDVIYVVKDVNGSIEYLTLKTDAMEGAYTLSSYSDEWYKMFTQSTDGLNVIRDGVRVSVSDLKSLDILYYSKDLNTVFAYSKKITGVYEKANPNKDTPTSVVISGTEYKIETAAAFNKLSSTGSINYGDTVTLLFGKDGQVADVVSGKSENSSDALAAYLISTGTKTFTNSNGEEYSSKYISLIYPDGTNAEYAVKKDYTSYRNSVMLLDFSDGTASLNKVNTDGISGLVDANNMTIGKEKMADNIKILDVSTTNKDHMGNAVITYPVRLDGVSISQSSVLWVSRNSKNEIDELILKDVTGDSCEYGIVTSAPESAGKNSNYSVNIGGSICSYSGGYYSNIKVGTPVKAEFSNGKISALSSIKALSGNVTDITQTEISVKGEKYKLSDKVKIYSKINYMSYDSVSLSDLKEAVGDTSISAYYDNTEKNGGRIRIIIIN